MKKKKIIRKFVVNPREVAGCVDYAQAISDTPGLHVITDIQKQTIRDFSKSKALHPFLKHGLFSFQNNLTSILNDCASQTTFYVVTGRGPSNQMHLGHLIPFIMAKWLQQEFNCNVYIQLADDEKFLNKQHSMSTIRDYAYENMRDIAALGFDENKTFMFSDTDYIRNIYQLALRVSKQLDLEKIKGPLGLSDTKNPALYFYPALQIAPMMFETNRKCLSVIGLDQYAYIQVQNKIAPSLHCDKSASLASKFLPSLNDIQGKMNASLPDGTIYLSDSKEEAERKIEQFATSKGFVEKAYYFLYYLSDGNDRVIKSLKLLSGKEQRSTIKNLLKREITDFLEKHQRQKYISYNKIDSYLYTGELAQQMRAKIFK